MNRVICLLTTCVISLGLISGCSMGDCTSGAAATVDDVRPLLAGMSTNAFVAKRADGSEYRFDPRALDKPVVLSFYRGGWCPYCNRQLAMLRTAEQELRDLGYDVIFLSADRPEMLLPSLENPELGYTLLSDQTMAVARDFGVAFTVDDKVLARYAKVGIDLQEASGETHNQLPVPATFIVALDGTVAFQYANPNYKVRLEPELLLTAARLHIVNSGGQISQR